MRTHKPIEWESLRARLEASRAAVEQAVKPDAALLEAVYRKRAARLARGPDGNAPSAGRPVLVFQLGEGRWGIELHHLAEVLAEARCSPLPGAPPRLAGVVQVRGEIRPVWDLARSLGLPDLAAGGPVSILMLRKGGREIGVRTGAVEGVRTPRPEEHTVPPAGLPHVKWITADGVAILDPAPLWKEGFEMKDMRIGTRILLGFGVIVALTVAMGWYAVYKQASVRKFTEEMDSRDFRVLEALRGVAKSEEDMRATRELVLVRHLLQRDRLPGGGDPDASEQEWRASRDQNLKLLADLEQAAGSYESAALSSDRAGQWAAVRAAARRSQNALKALVSEAELEFALMDRGDVTQVVARMPAIEDLRKTYENSLSDAQAAVQQQIAVGRGEIAAFYEDTRTSVVVAMVLTTLAGILFSVLIRRSIAEPLLAFIAFADRVGKGDLTEQAPVSRKDELGELARSLNQMVGGLKEVAAQTRVVVENLNAATAEILASTQQQAASTAEQAAAVQQATATMAELGQSGAQITERARQVAAAAEATTSASAAGLQSVQNTNTTMESIREQSEVVAENVIDLSEKTQAIGEIIATVNEIAEQSHLLSLNAAIQAASAGEHGRSFAVVAGEMKSLAEQSKQATVQVRSILGDIQKAINSSVMLTEEAVKRVESGRQQAEVSDRAIRQLSENIEQSVQAFQQIVAGSSQQQIGFEQVTQAFRNIGTASAQTATSTKQSERAAANLSALAQQLRSAVERYRV